MGVALFDHSGVGIRWSGGVILQVKKRQCTYNIMMLV